MKAKEIASGNYFYWKPKDGELELARIKTISGIEVQFKCGDIGFISDLIPIPLTIDILKKNGLFEGLGVVHADYFAGYIRVNATQRRFECHIGGIHIRDIKYVHELQNWWYWTTGEELTLKL